MVRGGAGARRPDLQFGLVLEESVPKDAAAQDAKSRNWVRLVGLVGGPLLGLIVFAFLPHEFRGSTGEQVEFARSGRLTLLLMVWMGAWWLTEAIPVYATALLPVAVAPLLAIDPIADVARPYASPLIFLFMGGFLLGLAMQRWQLDRRIALLTLNVVGTRPANLIAGFMLATGVLSACISNTATTAMMLPIGMSVVRLFESREAGRPGDHDNFGTCLMLSIAYAASIGGISTIIGTPTNGFLAQFVEDQFGEQITFLRWLAIGLPVTVVMMPFAWWILTRVLHPVPRTPAEGGRVLIATELRRMGPPTRAQWMTLAVFLFAVVSWMTRPLLTRVVPGISDAGISITAGIALFAIPVNLSGREFVMDWPTARKLPFGILILFGGGLSLARAVESHGVAEFIGSQTGALDAVPGIVLVLIVAAGMIFLTELTSNAATAATIVPILAAIAPGLGLHPYTLIVPATIAASCAFMLPVATPPNAILFGSGYITIRQMCRAGLWLNLFAIAAVTTLMYAVILPLLGVGGGLD